MSSRRPSYDDRRRANEKLREQYKAHLEKLGKQPTTREVERVINAVSEEGDKKNKW